MQSSKFLPEDQELDDDLITTIAAAFDDANIENVLWGDCLLIVFGVPSGLDDVAFVVPDDKIAKAHAILLKMGFRDCMIYGECRARAALGFAASPNAHAHIDGTRFIGLYKKSETLWSIPSLKVGHNENNAKPDIISANDSSLPGPRPGRGRGAFPQTPKPVHIISAHRLTEAYILLILRDFEQPIEFFWRSMLTYVIEFLLEDGILDVRDLKPHHRRFIELIANPGDTGAGKIYEDFRSESMMTTEE